MLSVAKRGRGDGYHDGGYRRPAAGLRRERDANGLPQPQIVSDRWPDQIVSYGRTACLGATHALLSRRPAGTITDVAFACSFESLSSYWRNFCARYGHATSEVFAAEDTALTRRRAR